VASGNSGPSNFDFETWQQQYESRLAEQEAQGRATIRRLCGALRRLGIEQVQFTYDGSGDSGTIESFEVSPEIEPEVPEAYRLALEQAVLGLLPSGWEINEGSSGQVIIDVDSGDADVDHTWNPASDLGTLDDMDEA
jgi:hypothetical protein